MADQTVGDMVVCGQMTVRNMIRTLDAMDLLLKGARMPVER